MATLAQIISATMYNNSSLRQSQLDNIYLYLKTYSNDAMGTNQLDKFVLNASLGIAVRISLNVAQVANMALGI